MTQGLPGTWPNNYPSTPAEAVAPDGSDVWTALWVVGGGVVATLGLFAVAAWANSSDHKSIRKEIEEVDQDLESYKNSHAYVHAVIAQEQAMMHAGLQQQIDGLRTLVPASLAPTLAPAVATAGLSMPPTIYGEPRFVTSLPALVASAPPSSLTTPIASMAYTATQPAMAVAVPTSVPPGVPTAVSPAMAVAPASLPPHLEAAMASVAPMLRQSKMPTRRGTPRPPTAITARYPTIDFSTLPAVPTRPFGTQTGTRAGTRTAV